MPLWGPFSGLPIKGGYYTIAYMRKFAARSYDQKKKIPPQGVNLHKCKSKSASGLSRCRLTLGCIFAYVQIVFTCQQYTRVQILHICKICKPWVYQRMWKGINKTETSFSIVINFTILTISAFQLWRLISDPLTCEVKIMILQKEASVYLYTPF